MRYSISLDQKQSYVEIDEHMTSAELSIVQDMLVKAIETRKKELKKIENTKLGPMDDIEKIYPPLSIRTINCLKKVGINTIGDVLGHTVKEIGEISNLGLKSYTEIQDRFKEYGTFREEDNVGEETENL